MRAGRAVARANAQNMVTFAYAPARRPGHRRARHRRAGTHGPLAGTASGAGRLTEKGAMPEHALAIIAMVLLAATLRGLVGFLKFVISEGNRFPLFHIFTRFPVVYGSGYPSVFPFGSISDYHHTQKDCAAYRHIGDEWGCIGSPAIYAINGILYEVHFAASKEDYLFSASGLGNLPPLIFNSGRVQVVIRRSTPDTSWVVTPILFFGRIDSPDLVYGVLGGLAKAIAVAALALSAFYGWPISVG